MSLPVAILAGGLAKRLRPQTDRVPKILVDVAGRPFAEHQVELLARHGVSKVVFCLGYLGEQVVAVLGDGSRWGMQFEYAFDGPRLVGTGGAIRRALPRLGAAFFVMYGDSYLDCDFASIEAVFHASGKRGLMTVHRNEDRWDSSNVHFDAGEIRRYDKKDRDKMMCHIDYGLGVLTAEAFEPWRQDEEPFDLVEVYQRLIAERALAGYDVPTRFYEIGSPEGLAETRAHLSGARITP